jgi:hypothetical protein
MSERILSKYNLEILALADASQEYSGDLVAKLASRILDLEAENARLKEEIMGSLDNKTCSTCRYLDENQNCVLGIRCVNYALWQGRIL